VVGGGGSEGEVRSNPRGKSPPRLRKTQGGKEAAAQGAGGTLRGVGAGTAEGNTADRIGKKHSRGEGFGLFCLSGKKKTKKLQSFFVRGPGNSGAAFQALLRPVTEGGA